MNMFRTLRADEIDCRIAQIKEDANHKPKGLSLLLYKDARCDQNILDETVGPMRWQRKHTRDNANCIVSIWSSDLNQWIEKEDTGTESNTEKEKGLASDSFKRACFNWGIGRELYTSPFIWIKAEDCKIVEYRGKLACFDRFTVKGIAYTDGVITGLIIKNQATGKVCYTFGEVTEETEERPEQPDTEPDAVKPINQDAPATVSQSKKLPEEADPVGNYVRNEIAYVGEVLCVNDKAARKYINDTVKALVESGAVLPFDWKTLTIDEAKNIFTAIRELLPEKRESPDIGGDKK